MIAAIKSKYANKLFFISIIYFLFLFSCINIGVADTGVPYRNTGGVRMEGNAIYRYLLYLPDNYSMESQRRYPLLVYLHGKSCRGYNL